MSVTKPSFTGDESPVRSPRPDHSPNSSQRHDDPFQKFFEEKDHMNKDSPSHANAYAISENDDGLNFTPYEMSILHSLLSTARGSTIPVPALMSLLDFYIKPSAGGADGEYVAKQGVLAKALIAGGVRDEEGDIKTAETAAVLETNPAAFSGVHLHIGPSATPAALEYLLTNEKLCDEDHVAFAHKLLQLDTEKDGVFNLVLGFRELMRTIVPIMESKGNEDPEAAAEESREIVRRILNTASVNASAGYALSLSDFIELYAMEVYVIPPQYRTLDTAALTRRIDLSDYSLLWAAINQIRGIGAEHIEAALTEAASVEGVVADECSLRAIIKCVTSFIEFAADKGLGTDDALQQLADILVTNPTSLHIPVMPAEHRQEVAARKLFLYFKPSAVLSVLRALLLEDIRGDGILSKPMAEAALMVELSSSSHKQHEQQQQQQQHLNASGVDEVEEYAGVDQSRVEEMIRNVLLSAGVAESHASQEVNLSHFIQTLIELTPVLPSRYCSYVVVKFKPSVQLNELEHLQQLLQAAIAKSGDALSNPVGYGCVTESDLRAAIEEAFVNRSDDGIALAKSDLFAAFKELALNGNALSSTTAFGGEGAFSINVGDGSTAAASSNQLIDIAEALSVAIFETSAVTFHIASLSDYHASLVTSRRVAKGNVRHIAKAFIILDASRSKALRIDGDEGASFREVMKSNPKFTSSEVLEEAFATMDIDMDGALCFEEFLSSFNHGPRGAVLSKAQLSSLTMRRASVKELHEGPSASATPRSHDEAQEQLQANAVTTYANGPAAIPNRESLITSLSSGLVPTTQLVAASSPLRKSTKALSPQHDASGVPVDDHDLRAEFERYDVDGNGYLNRREFVQTYRSMENFGLEPSDRDIENLFNRVCGNRHHVTFDEFCLLMLRRSRM